MNGIALYNSDFFGIKSNNDLLKENITRILLTSPGERAGNIEFGSRLKGFIFESYDVLQEEVVDEIRKSIARWEPRVEIKGVDVKMLDSNRVYLYIEMVNKQTLDTFDFETTIRY